MQFDLHSRLFRIRMRAYCWTNVLTVHVVVGLADRRLVHFQNRPVVEFRHCALDALGRDLDLLRIGLVGLPQWGLGDPDDLELVGVVLRPGR